MCGAENSSGITVRVAAAARIADLLGEKVGASAGYRTRLDRCVSAATRIELVTEGILARRLQRDPGLDGVGLVIGSRIVGGSEEYTPVRAFGNVVLTLAVGLFMKRFLSDALNGYKAFRRDVFTDFRYTSRNFEIEIELIANALRRGYQIVEVCSHERQRAGGQAKSRVIKHGTLFLSRIILESCRGIKPKSALS